MTDMIDRPTMQQAHGQLEESLDELLAVSKLLTQLTGVGNDTYFALGQAFGLISKAKALLGRDIDSLPPAS